VFRRFTIGTALVLLTAASLAAAGQPVHFEISPQFGQSFGETSYEIKLAGYLDNPTDIVTLRSRLKFPVENKLVGATAGLYAGYGLSPKWSLEAGFLSNLGDPSGVITDQDWIGQLNQFEIEWSNTESDAEGTYLQVDLTGTLLLLDRNRFSVALLGGFSYEKIDQNVIGVAGWQLQPGSTLFDFGDPIYFALGDSAVGDYRITYKTPHVGLATRLFLSPRTSFLLKTSAVVAFFDDHDDHLLRGKVADADGDGFGFRAALSFRHEIGSGRRMQPFFALEGSTLILSADGKQKQTWYADDPATPDVDDTGTTYGQIPYSVDLKQYSIMLRFGLGF
jgi:hypothetical protein